MENEPSMDCRGFEKRLEQLLIGELPINERARAEVHLDSCARCARLLGVLRGELDDTPDADTLVARTLSATVGSACARAETNLCAWVDNELEAADAGLVALHLEHCASCAALATALRALPHDLAVLREIDPGPEFTRAVLERTRRSVAQAAPARRGDWLERLRASWQDLLLRPRAAMELATLGCFVLVLLCGMPFSPMREVPRQALSVAQINPVAAATSSAQQLQPLWSDYGAPAWQRTGARLVDRAGAAAREFADRRPQTVEAWGNVRTHAAEAGSGVWHLDGARVSRAVDALGDDFALLWEGLWNAQPDQAVPEPSEE